MTYGRFADIPVRPLNKGMFTDLPRNGIPLGGFEDIKNFRVNQGYLETRGGLWPYFDGQVELTGSNNIAYDFDNLREKIEKVIYHWKTTSQSETIVLSEDFLYTMVNQNTLNLVELTSDEITVTPGAVSGNLLDLTVTAGDISNVSVGDYCRDFGDTVVYGRVVNILGSVITIEFDAATIGIPTSIEFIYSFQIAPGYTIDHTILGGYGTDEAGNEMLLTDVSGRGVYKYSDDVLSIYPIDSSPEKDGLPENQVLQSAKCITFFDDRVFLGNITETSGNNFPQRIWWSDALDFDRFNPASYIDLPYSQGELLMIKPLGPLLVLYFTDTIYIGRPTQIIGRPYEFQELNTNGIGLVAQKALATYDDGHFFVGQDDIYYLTGSGGLKRIGSSVEIETVRKTANLKLLDYVQVASDPSTESVAFLFPDADFAISDAIGLSTRIWRFYYKPEAWAYDEVPIINDQPQCYFSCISMARTVTKNETYTDWQNREINPANGDPEVQTSNYTVTWPGDNTLKAIYNTDPAAPGTAPPEQERWVDLESYADLNSFAISSPRLMIGVFYLDSNNYWVQNICYEVPENNQDELGGITYDIDFQLISPDYDFGKPDKDKFTRQFSIRTFEHADTFFQPNIWITDGRTRINNAGRQEIFWLRAPTLKYFTNYNEGRTGFLIRGSIFKFKVQFTRSTERYRLSEFVIRTKVEGDQVDL